MSFSTTSQITPGFVALNNTHLFLHSFSRSQVWAQLARLLCSHSGPCQAAINGLIRGSAREKICFQISSDCLQGIKFLAAAGMRFPFCWKSWLMRHLQSPYNVIFHTAPNFMAADFLKTSNRSSSLLKEQSLTQSKVTIMGVTFYHPCHIEEASHRTA